MDIPSLSTAMSQQNVMSQFSVGVLRMSMDTMETFSEGMQKVMEQSVAPNLGANIDITV